MCISNRKDYIVQEYQCGRSSTSIAKELKCSAVRICQILRENRVEIRYTMTPSIRITQLEPKMLEMWNSGIHLEKIGKELGIAQGTVKRRLNKLGVSTSKKTDINKIMIHSEQIVKLYEELGSTWEIGKIFDTSSGTIHRVLTRCGVQIKKRKLYTVDENFFEIIDSQDRAWVAGLFYSDGCCVTDKPIIKLQLKDRETVEKAKTLLKYTGPINIAKQREPYADGQVLSIYSNKLKTDLVNLGCLENKSLILQYPTEEQIPKNLRSHFIRGYLDGDGSIYNYDEYSLDEDIYAKWGMSFIGTLEVMEGILQDIKSFVEVEYWSLFKSKNDNDSNTYQLAFNGKNCIKILEWIYKDAQNYMERKYQKYINLIDYYKFKSGQIEEFEFFKLGRNNTHNPNSIMSKLLEIKEEIYEMSRSGMSSTAIAKKLNVSTSYIATILKKGGIKLRQITNPQKIDLMLCDIEQDFKNGTKIKQISEKLGISDRTISKRLQKLGYDTNPGRTLEEVEKDLEAIIKSYKELGNTAKVAELFDTSAATILRILDKHGIEHHKRVKYTVDSTYFNSIDSEEKAYIFGAFHATGNIKRTENATMFGSKHKSLVELIKEKIKYTGPVEEDRGHFRIKISNIEMKESLSGVYGEGKKEGLNFPELREDLIPHFIRGYFEARGRIDWLETQGRIKWVVSFPGDTNIFNKVTEIFVHKSLISKLDKYKNYGESQLKWLNYIYDGSTIYHYPEWSKYKQMQEYYPYPM